MPEVFDKQEEKEIGEAVYKWITFDKIVKAEAQKKPEDRMSNEKLLDAYKLIEKAAYDAIEEVADGTNATPIQAFKLGVRLGLASKDSEDFLWEVSPERIFQEVWNKLFFN